LLECDDGSPEEGLSYLLFIAHLGDGEAGVVSMFRVRLRRVTAASLKARHAHEAVGFRDVVE
jgi:hypothetical protein